MTDVKSCTVTLRPRPGDPSNRDFMLTNAGDPTCLDAPHAPTFARPH